MGVSVTTYQPDNCLKKGYVSIFREIYDEVRRNRWLTYQLFRRDLLAMYKQSFIGVSWAFIIPLISVGTFILLNQSGVFSVGSINVPYPLYALLGMAFWQIFSTGLIASSNSLVKAGTMIVKINFSKKSLVIASFGQSIVPFLIQFILVIILFLYYQIIPPRAIWFLPLMVIPLVLFTLGLGFILSLINGVVRDVGNIISILLTFLMFLTPVFYVKPTTGVLAYLTKYNLLYYMIAVPRDLVLTGRIHERGGFLLSAVMAVMVFIGCVVVFHLTETRVAERI